MAGYSGTPLPRKLGIKAGARLAIVSAPDGFAQVLGGLPPGVVHLAPDAEELEVVVLFATRMAQLADQFAGVASHVAPAGSLWVAWPKRRSGLATDLSENSIRDVGLACGMVDNKVCAIDEVWSGLRFVVRLENRLAWPLPLGNADRKLHSA